MKKLSLNKRFFFDVIGSTIIATVISLVFVLIFALIVNLAEVGENLILPINEAIKIISILLGCFIGFKAQCGGAFKGALTGLCYTLLSVMIFGLINHDVKFNMLSLIDIGLGIIAGAISGILVVNLKKKSVTE